MSKTSLFKSIFLGTGAGVGLLGIYIIVMTLGTGSLQVTTQELLKIKLWVSALVLGFGVQVGFYSYLKSCLKTNNLVSSAAATTSGATSTTAMVACCAHHIVDVLPLIGLSALAALLTRYQQQLLLAAVLINLIGIGFMVYQIKKIRRTSEKPG